MCRIMVFNVQFDKEYTGRGAYLQAKQEYYSVKKQIENFGHIISCDEDGRGESSKFILADYLPLAVLDMRFMRWKEELRAALCMNVRHFFEKDKRFPELEKIARSIGIAKMKIIK